MLLLITIIRMPPIFHIMPHSLPYGLHLFLSFGNVKRVTPQWNGAPQVRVFVFYGALRDGAIDFEEKEVERSEFHGKVIRSPIHGKEMLFFPPKEFFLRVVATSTFTTGLICVVLLTMMSLFILKIVLRTSPSFTYNGVELGGILVSIIQSFVMVVCVQTPHIIVLSLLHLDLRCSVHHNIVETKQI